MTTLDKILQLLKSQNKTQKELMDYLGLGKTAFTGWKNGSNRSYFKHIGKVADFFNVSADYLLGKEEAPDKNRPEPNFTYALFRGNEDVTDEMQNEIDAYVATIKKRLPSNESKLTSEQEELINLYVSAPPEIQAAALAVLKSAEAARKSRGDEEANQ